MRKSAIHREFRRRFDAVRHSFKAMKKDPGQTELHAYRVAIKKLRAFLRLLQSGHPHSPSLPKKLKKLYDQAGRARNLQLLLQQFRANSVAVNWAQHQFEQVITQLRKMMVEIRIRSIGKKLEGQIPAHFSNRDSRHFEEHHNDQMASIAGNGAIQYDDLHTLRKQMKELMYDLPAYKTRYESLAEKLGKFQDARVMLDLLQECRMQKNPEQAADILPLIKKQRLVMDRMANRLKKSMPSSIGVA